MTPNYAVLEWFESTSLRRRLAGDKGIDEALREKLLSSNPTRYWHDLKRKSSKTEGQPYDFIVSLKLMASDGRQRLTDCANTEGVFRILMSVPSPKVEPLKLWLASLGKQAIDETENPELLT